MSRVVILGAGPCGLGAAWFLKNAGFRDFHLIEATDSPGGLARSFVDSKGFTWDIGGHVQFSHYEDFDEVMNKVLKDEWLVHQRESWVRMNQRWIPYPFQMNLHRLPDELRDECLSKLKLVRRSGELKNFADWMQSSFGEGIVDCFMRPYNFKVWAHPAELMSYQWIGERVAQVDVSRVEENIKLNRDDVSWGPNATFRFPRQGGTGEIWKRVAREVGDSIIRLNSKVSRIDLENKKLHLQDGAIENYDILFSTLPLDTFSELSSLSLKGELLHSSSHIVGIGLEGKIPEELKTKCWIYFPEENSPFYRATVFSNYSPNHVPDPSKNWSLMCETAESKHRPVDADRLIEKTIEGLLRTGILDSKSKIVSKWHFKASHGYPIPSLDRDEIVHDYLHRLEGFSVYSRGRFGLWKYEVSNQDHSFMQGFEWASWYLNGTPEETYKNPTLVNAPGKRSKLPLKW